MPGFGFDVGFGQGGFPGCSGLCVRAILDLYGWVQLDRGLYVECRKNFLRSKFWFSVCVLRTVLFLGWCFGLCFGWFSVRLYVV